MKPFWGFCLLAFLHSFALPARAQVPSVSPTPQPSETAAQSEWYGWQTLLTDAASITLITAGAMVQDGNSHSQDGNRMLGTSLMLTGLAGYVAGAPIMHFGKRQPGRGLGSIAMRVSLPFVGGVIGAESASCHASSDESGYCGVGEAALGVGLGALTAIALDASVLAWAPMKEEGNAEASFGFAPVIAKDGKSAELRVFGRF